MKTLQERDNDAALAMTIAKRAVWDTGVTPEDFLAVLRGELFPVWPTRAFCVARLLECASWYDVVRVMEPAEICAMWPAAERYVRSPSLRKGMEYACRILQ